jgi:uncharacterized SAM-binding protein YcdF (DUF218 family)
VGFIERIDDMNNRLIKDMTNFIFIADELRKADAIIIPGGSDPAVPEKAAEIYKSGYAPVIIPTGGVSIKTGRFNGVRRKQEIYNGDYKTDYEFMTDVLIKNGVPASTILSEDKSGYTKENALFSRKVADENGLDIKTLIIVCKSFHARRCLMCWQLAFPEAEILIVPVDTFDITRDNWHTFDYGIERVMGELSRCGNQFVDEMKEYTKQSSKIIQPSAEHPSDIS